MEIRKKLLEILQDLRPDVDFETETMLVSHGILESFDIVALIAELSETFELDFNPQEVVAENFDSLDALVKMIERLQNA